MDCQVQSTGLYSIQGPHHKSTQKEILSHTLSSIYLYGIKMENKNFDEATLWFCEALLLVREWYRSSKLSSLGNGANMEAFRESEVLWWVLLMILSQDFTKFDPGGRRSSTWVSSLGISAKSTGLWCILVMIRSPLQLPELLFLGRLWKDSQQDPP